MIPRSRPPRPRASARNGAASAPMSGGEVADLVADTAGRACRCRSAPSPPDRPSRGNGRRTVDARPRPEIDQHPLHDLLHVLGRDERRLEIDLGELRLAVGAKVLVAEAARDLEIAVVPRHHQQLLVDLGRLRQRVELARVDAAGHEIVARAFRASAW